ncbi:MAG: DUF1924 domain-containing protein [Gammaproteobacteria bacterium]
MHPDLPNTGRAALMLCAVFLTGPVQAADGAHGDGAREVLAALRADGPFDAANGATLWTTTSTHKGKPRACADCHGNPPVDEGRHVRTRKTIAPLALSANPKSLASAKHINKWLKRNCKWTWGRECSAREKGDLLTYLLTVR